MPSSMIEQRVDAAWADLATAVSAGLTAKDEATLAALVPVIPMKPAAAEWLCPETRPVGDGWLRWRESEPPSTVIDYEFRLRVGYDELESPNLRDITAWAAAARADELFDVLDRLASVAGPAKESTVRALDDVAPKGGWGSVTCVAFKLGRADSTSLDWVKRLGWNVPVPPAKRLPSDPRIDCLLLRGGGGPQLRRTAELTLGWLPVCGEAVDLVLAERLEIVGAGSDTVTAIRLAPSLA